MALEGCDYHQTTRGYHLVRRFRKRGKTWLTDGHRPPSPFFPCAFSSYLLLLTAAYVRSGFRQQGEKQKQKQKRKKREIDLAKSHNVSRPPFLEICAGTILSWVNFFIARPLDNVIVAGRQDRAKQRSEPVYPVVAGKTPRGHRAAEAASRVEGTSCGINT